MTSADYCIVMTLCNRPAYTKQVLEALAKCDGIEGRPVAFSIEPVNKEVIRLAKAFREPRFIHIGQKQLGCNCNTYYALSMGFSEYDQVVALEETDLIEEHIGVERAEHDPAVHRLAAAGHELAAVALHEHLALTEEQADPQIRVVEVAQQRRPQAHRSTSSTPSTGAS